jgi:O-antigen/teichoic acid export membrane protein
MPLIAVYSPLVALVLNVALNLALVPSMGFAGAAVSSSVAYGLMLVMSPPTFDPGSCRGWRVIGGA